MYMYVYVYVRVCINRNTYAYIHMYLFTDTVEAFCISSVDLISPFAGIASFPKLASVIFGSAPFYS